MEDLINNITDNVFQYVSISEQENVEQWKKDRDEFKEQLMIEINSIQDKEVRTIVLARLLKNSQNENGKNFVNANGHVNFGKIKGSTKSIQNQVEQEIIAKREVEDNVHNTIVQTIKDGTITAIDQEKIRREVEEDFKDFIPKDWSKDEVEEFKKKMAFLKSNVTLYLALKAQNVPEEEILQQLGVVSEEDKELFHIEINKYNLSQRKEELEKKKEAGTISKEEEKELNSSKKNINELNQQQIDIYNKYISQQKGSATGQQKEDGERSSRAVAELQAAINSNHEAQKQIAQDEDVFEVENEIKSDLKNGVKQVIMTAIYEGIDNMDDFTAIVESGLEGIEDQSLRAKVGKAIEQLTQLPKLGNSEKSFEELLEAGELDEAILDSALESKAPKMEEPESTIQDSVANTVYIEQSESIAIDEKWERVCQEAQERGESLRGATLEKLLSTYMQEEGLQQVEAPKSSPSVLGEKAGEDKELGGSKSPVIESIEAERTAGKGESKKTYELQANGEDRSEDDEEKNDYVEKREYADKNGDKKKTAYITNDSNGEVANVQVFNPLEFTRNSNVRTGQINGVTAEIAELGQVQKSSADKGTKDEQEDVKE